MHLDWTTGDALDFDHLLKLRLVVARVGEMDLAKWWNTNGLLGRKGRILLSRGFPRTHSFAQARAVFAVATARSRELFDPPGCMTLWSLPAEIEDQFDGHWQGWLENREDWAPFFSWLEAVRSDDLLDPLKELGLLDPDQLGRVLRLRRSAEGRSVRLSGTHQPSDETFALLAAGFARGEVGKPAIPYARLEGA